MTEENEERRRQRKVKRTVRLTTMEDAVLRVLADRAGLTIASYLRKSALKMPPPDTGRTPSIDRQMASQLMAAIGEVATAFRDAAHLVDPQLAETTMNSINEYRIVVFESLGRAP